MKKIAICTLNSKYVHASLAPWCLLAGLETHCRADIQAEVVEATVNQPVEQVLQRLLEGNYDFFAFSCYIWNISPTKNLLSLLKEARPDCMVALGGPEVSYSPEEVLKNCDSADFVLSGEGELPFSQLIEAVFEDKMPLSQVFGLSYRENQQIITASPYQTMEIPPSPYSEEYFQNLGGKISYMESSRGCPFSCAFCLSGRGERVRYYPMERVRTELVKLANSGTQTVKFIDRTFNSKASHADAILSFLLEEYGKSIPKTVCFHFEMAGDILQESTLDLLSKMPKGYVQLEIGMQSFCEKTLEAVGRKTNISRLIQNIQRLVSFENHHLHIDLIAGLPYEDLEEFSKSFDIGYGLGASMLQLGFLKVLQGSEIGANPEKFPCEYDKNPPYQVISTPWLSEKDLELLEIVEDGVDRLYNSGRFSRTLPYLLEVSGLRPFDLFVAICTKLEFSKNPSLDAYIDEFFRVGQGISGVDKEKFRDILLLDRVETNSTGILPESLKVPDQRLRQLTKDLEKNPQTARPKHGKRFVGILYSENKGIYVDYPEKTKGNKHDHQIYRVNYVLLP